MADRAGSVGRQYQGSAGAESTASPPRPPRKWRCLNCGQMVFTAAHDLPADVCQFCKDMTTWQALQE